MNARSEYEAAIRRLDRAARKLAAARRRVEVLFMRAEQARDQMEAERRHQQRKQTT